MARDTVHALSVAVMYDYKVDWAEGYGVIEVGGAPATAETRFQAASVSKPVTALAVMKLWEQKRIDLDLNVNLTLKSWRVPENMFTATEKVTVRRLLSHTAGTTVSGVGEYTGPPLPQLLEILDGVPPARSAPVRVDIVPGTRYRYSGGGYTVLQQLLIDVQGKAFPELLGELVLVPLGMTHSTFEQPLPTAWEPVTAREHAADGTRRSVRWHLHPDMAAAGLWTTPTDLALVAIEMASAVSGRGSRVLAPDTARLMLTAVLNGYGLGFGTSGSRFSHVGLNTGYRCSLLATSAGDGLVIMTNSDGGPMLASDLTSFVRAEYQW